jgi:hypothetical protein
MVKMGTEPRCHVNHAVTVGFCTTFVRFGAHTTFFSNYNRNNYFLNQGGEVILVRKHVGILGRDDPTASRRHCGR